MKKITPVMKGVIDMSNKPVIKFVIKFGVGFIIGWILSEFKAKNRF